MSSTLTIQLHHLRFTAAHGVLEEEALVGNKFEVNLSLTVKAPEKVATTLDETINYATVYGLVKNIFAERKALLETLAMEITEELKKAFPSLRKASIQIIKLHPPISTFTGSVSVTYNRKFKDS